MNVKRRIMTFLSCSAVVVLLFGLTTVQAENGRRYALLIGGGYAGNGGQSTLPGCYQDVSDMREMLLAMDQTLYEVSAFPGADASLIREAIETVFGAAKDDDVCLFFYAGHGYEPAENGLRGALTGADGEIIPLESLCGMLRNVHGTKILILDSCYSGRIVPYAAAASGKNDFRILCAAGPDDKTEEMSADGERYGLFTRLLLAGSEPGSLTADRNGDGSVTIMEAYYDLRARGFSPTVWTGGHDDILWGINGGTSQH